jgi:hypothetical protein
MINAYKILVRKPEVKQPLGRLKHRREDNIRMDLKKGPGEGSCKLGGCVGDCLFIGLVGLVGWLVGWLVKAFTCI